MKQLSLSGSDFGKLFPFHLSIGPDSKVLACGDSLRKIIPIAAGDHINDHFHTYRPHFDTTDYATIRSNLNTLFILETNRQPRLKIRGQWLQPEGQDQLVFVGSPWFDSVESLNRQGLKITDFAIHDPLVDLLHIIKTNEIGMNDLKEVLSRFEKQRIELKNLSLIATETVNSIVITDAQGGITWVNKSFEKMTGYSLVEVKGRKPGAFLQGENTDKNTVLYMSRQIREGKPFQCEIQNYRKDGNPFWLRIIGQPILDADGSVEQFFAIEEDITEDKENLLKLTWSEQKYRGIIENMDLGLVEFDTEDTILYCNQSFCNLTGFQENEMIGRHAGEILLEKNINLDATFGLKKRHRGITDVYEAEISDRTGNRKWILVSKAMLFDTQKRITGSIGIFLDISWRKKLEVELKEARESAVESSKAKENFLVNMSHEIRTPMNVILGMSRHLGNLITEEKQQRYLHSINSAAENLLVIINDVLDISKIESGKMEIEKIGFRPRTLLNQCAQLLGFKAEEKGLQLNCDVDKDVPEIVIGDPHRLHQVLMNVGGNAVKFTELGSIDISAYIDHVEKETIRLKIVVEDTGIGIDEDRLEEVFESFKQESSSISRQYGGSGLGLTISRELARLMQGDLRIDSQKGVGTRVIIELPLTIGSKGDLDESLGNAFDATQLRNKRILVVEDNLMNLTLAETVLQTYDADVSTATSGNEAISIATSKEFDMILMDLRLPGMDGLETSRQLRHKHGIEVPIIALTANTRPELREALREAGINDYLLKPYKESLLIGKITHLLAGQPPVQKKSAPKVTAKPAKLYDTSKLEAFTVKNPDFLRRMLQLFIEETASGFKELQESLQKGDHVRVGDLAHRMKPGIDQLMAEELLIGIKKIEQMAKQGDPDRLLKPLVGDMDRLLSELIEQIKQNEL